MKSILYATLVTAVLTPLITIWSELNSVVKTFFTRVGTHHWVGKGITLAVVWVVVAVVLQKILKHREVTDRQMQVAIGVHIVSAAVILAFFAIEA